MDKKTFQSAGTPLCDYFHLYYYFMFYQVEYYDKEALIKNNIFVICAVTFTTQADKDRLLGYMQQDSK